VLKIPASFHFSIEAFDAAGVCSYMKRRSSKVVVYFNSSFFLGAIGLIAAGSLYFACSCSFAVLGLVPLALPLKLLAAPLGLPKNSSSVGNTREPENYPSIVSVDLYPYYPLTLPYLLAGLLACLNDPLISLPLPLLLRISFSSFGLFKPKCSLVVALPLDTSLS